MIWLLIGFILFIVAWFLEHTLYVVRPGSHVLYFGEVGCGKTMFLTRLAYKYYKKKIPVYSNYPIYFPVGSTFKLSKSMLGTFRFPAGSVLLFDEASLNGFDNRDFKDNFKNNNSLEYLKLIRHYQNSMIWSNQGWDECDKKIRTLCSQYWLVKKLPFFSVGIRYFVRPGTSEDDDFKDRYVTANVFRLLFDPRCLQLVFRPKYGKFYDSWETPPLPLVNSREWRSYVYPKS